MGGGARFKKLKEDGRFDSEKLEEYLMVINSSLMTHIRNLTNIVGLQNGSKRAISKRLFTEYITYCGKKYGPRAYL